MARLRQSWLVAAWPGMGQVGVTAAYYLMSKLSMHQVAEFPARDLFELEDVEIHSGIIRAAQLPRSRLFVWEDPERIADIVVFIGEAQPPTGKLELCKRLVELARGLGLERVLTFAAMATGGEPAASRWRVLGAATNPEGLDELQRHDVSILREGRIGGLNGVLLAAAAEAGLPGIALLGEMPGLVPQLPFPSASAAVLRAFNDLSGIPLDLRELEDYGSSMQDQLKSVYEEVRHALEPEPPPGPPPPEPVPGEAMERIEKLFEAARQDRRRAFDLKRELDKHGLFARFEDRFLELFRGRQGGER